MSTRALLEWEGSTGTHTRCHLECTPAGTDVKPSTEQSTQQVDDANADVVLDWKGEPMHIRKGDKMPKFL
ncbi:hypothetical protein HaLaN_29344 [Haematococcus lacustris]|uniref:Uncharacterized protein n=1 Tax=Haematococcus lacustris TaxID=44745 RepID=A0A6A0ACT1_HAELA|nr:hypothetical protein HaLaN_29344 [Haematococcus lacustris]